MRKTNLTGIVLPFCSIIDFFRENLLQPLIDVVVAIIQPILDNFIQLFVDEMKKAFAEIFYSVFVMMLNVVSFLQAAFDFFAGTKYVGFQGNDQVYLVNVFLRYGPLNRALWILTLMGILLAFIFTIYSVIKSMGDLEGEYKKSVGKVLLMSLKTVITFFIVPLIVFFGIDLSARFLAEIDTQLNHISIEQNQGNTGQTSIANTIFVASTMTAAINGPNNQNAFFQDSLRRDYYFGIKSYEDEATVKDDFELKDLEFLSGFICAGFLIYILMSACFIFIARLLELMLLYLISPIFVAFIPLDEGQKFAVWRDMFIAKALSGFGVVIVMRLFLIIVPSIMNQNVQLSSDASYNNFMKLLFVIGGCYAVYKGQSLFLQIINPTAAGATEERMQMIKGTVMFAAGSAKAKLLGAASRGMGAMANRGSGNSNSAASTRSGKQKF